MYEWQEGMREITGMGEKLDKECQKMFKAGMEWFDRNPDADPKFSHNPEIFGIVWGENEDAQALHDAIVAAVDDCSGAAFQVTLGHILQCHKNGWEWYVAEMKKAE